MARQARIQSKTGIYHIILRGNNKQQIFLEDDDYKKFLKIIMSYKKICGFEMLAYCLMGNHIHLLIKTGETDLASIMKRIVVKFVYYYNVKYVRVGHLFQDRFKSEPVEDDAYLLQVVRYIHQNPIKARIIENPEDYIYSSYREYIKSKTDNAFVDTDFVMDMISVKEFKKYHQYVDYKCKCIDVVDSACKISDDKGLEIIKELCIEMNFTNINEQPKEMQREFASNLKKQGLSVRQIVRLTGLSKRVVELS